MPDLTDEFTWIESLRALTRGDPRALDLADDAAIAPARPGFDLVISVDAMIEGVHFLADEAADVVARRLLRTSLSDLAAKAVQPFGYLLTTAWPSNRDAVWRARFRDGLDEDGRRYGVALFGGDTVSTPGPLALNATVLGWIEAGRMVRRSGAMSGDAMLACGAIGDGWLGLKAARGEITDGDGALARAYRLPEPRFDLRQPLRLHAHAAADVSDGLIADAGHIAAASGLGLEIQLEDLPLSRAAKTWVASQPVRAEALAALAGGGDDYAIACAVPEDSVAAVLAAARAGGSPAARVGRLVAGAGLKIMAGEHQIRPARSGFRHGG
jgi:thiamine-monophosphate kinase